MDMLHEITEHAVQIPSSTPGIELAGKILMPNTAEKKQWPAVLFMHGYADNEQTHNGNSTIVRAEHLAKHGFTTLMFHARGLCGSDGQWKDLTDSDAVNDLAAVYEWFGKNEHVEASRMGLYGSSWGGYLAGMSLVDTNPASLFLNVPALYEEAHYNQPLGQTTSEERRCFRAAFQGRDHEVFRRMQKYKGPICTMIVERDELVPLNCQTGYLLASGHNPDSEAHVLKGCGHKVKEYPESEKELRNLIVEWFERTLERT